MAIFFFSSLSALLNDLILLFFIHQANFLFCFFYVQQSHKSIMLGRRQFKSSFQFVNRGEELSKLNIFAILHSITDNETIFLECPDQT